MKITIERKPKSVVSTCINSYDFMGFEGIGTWLNYYGVSFLGSVKDYKRIGKTQRVSEFYPVDLTPLLMPASYQVTGLTVDSYRYINDAD